MESAASGTGLSAGSPGATILIVDDTPPNIGLLHAMLQPRGYQLFAASSGRQALEIAERVRPDLILLDVMMPGLDGFATCRALKSHAATAAVPVIFITACSDSEDVARGFQAGAADYLAKPIRVEEVLARVHTQLQLRFSRRQEQAAQAQLQALVEAVRTGLLPPGPTAPITHHPASAGRP